MTLAASNSNALLSLLLLTLWPGHGKAAPDNPVTLVKSAAVTDPFGGTEPIPGAQIEYQVRITLTGTGTAANSIFADPIPTNTRYVPGTMELNGVTLTDAADADVGEFITAPNPRIQVTLGDLTGASGVQTITFSVTIE